MCMLHRLSHHWRAPADTIVLTELYHRRYSSSPSNGASPSTPRSYSNLDNSVPYRPGHIIPRYDPYAPARPATHSPVASSSVALPPGQQPSMPTIRFKYSPFFKIERLASTVVECPGELSIITIEFIVSGSQIQQSQRLRWIVVRSHLLSPCRVTSWLSLTAAGELRSAVRCMTQ